MIILPREPLERLRARLARLYGEAITERLIHRFGLLVGRYQEDTDWNGSGAPLWDESDAVLITYGDMIRREGEAPLRTLQRFLKRHLVDSLTTVHILPFFPYSSDDGFAVIDYRQVNRELGTWEDVRAIGADFDLMFDLVLNHVSSRSEWFRNYQVGLAPHRHYFIEVEPDTDLSMVVRPRTSPLLTPTQTPGGERWVWTTFSADQVDLNFANQDVLFEFLDILLFYIEQGARILRLDAIAYLWKEIGTPCINLPQTHEVVKLFRDVVEMLAPGTLLLTETNLPHAENISYFGDGDEAHMVYQFSLPPLLLHAMQFGTTRYLTEWARNLPEPPPGCTFLNFTASHDGIGVRPLEGLVPPEEIQAVVERVRQLGGLVSSRRLPDGSESPYELNITYFDAMGDPVVHDPDLHIRRFLCSQTVQMALQGIPAVYFHSLTASHNDYFGVNQTGQNRAINRGRWSESQLEDLLADGSSVTARVFQEYTRRLQLRAAQPAFHPDAPQRVLDLEDGLFGIERSTDAQRLLCINNLSPRAMQIPAASLPAPSSGPWVELLGGRSLPELPESLRLEPYGTLWLSSGHG